MTKVVGVEMNDSLSWQVYGLGPDVIGYIEISASVNLKLWMGGVRNHINDKSIRFEPDD